MESGIVKPKRKSRKGTGLIRYVVLLAAGAWIALGAGTARAQLSVAITSSGTQTTSPGTTVDAGAFTVTDTSTTTGVTITQVQISIGNPSLFSAMSVTGTAPDGTSQTESLPLQQSSTVSFTGLPLSIGEAATFTLSATIAGSPTPTPSANDTSVAFASIWPASRIASNIFLAILGMALLSMLGLDGRLKRWILMALVLVLAVTAGSLGCGDCSLYGCGSSGNGIGSSEQQVTGIGSSQDFSVTGVPADLGTITSQ
jgi:hypothetical protein